MFTYIYIYLHIYIDAVLASSTILIFTYIDAVLASSTILISTYIDAASLFIFLFMKGEGNASHIGYFEYCDTQ